MRRKNMLALGLSFVLGVGASSTLTYALPLEQEESLQTSASEVGNTEETASNAETVTETAVEKDTTEGSSAVEEREASDKEKEEAEEESSLSTEALGGTDRAAEETLTPLSRSRRALADTPRYASEEEEKEDRRNRITAMMLEFNTLEAVARDHMKVVREKPITVRAYAEDIYGVPQKVEQVSIRPNRTVEKKINGQWTEYTLDYFTPGVYRYKYILDIQKGSTLYVAAGEEYNGVKTVAIAYIKGPYFYGIENASNDMQNIVALEKDSAKGRKYLLESGEFTVEAQKTISKVYLKSSFDIHNVHVGDLMKRATLSTEKIVLTDGTEIKPDPNPIFFINPYDSYPNNLDQWKLMLDSFKTEEGYIGDVFDIKETKAFDPGRYQISYLLQQNHKIDKYRLLVKGTDDNYGNGTEFYVNNELYITEMPAKPEADLTPSPLITSPLFDAKKVENPSNNSSGNSASSSRGNSGSSSSSSSSGGSSSGSGGGSGSFKVSSSFAGQVLGVDRSLSGGQWIQDEKGWWYKRADGSYPKNSWGYEAYNGKSYWYYFLDSGYMATGWVDVNGSKYYLFPNSDGWKGRMLTGWQWIDGNCYYLDTQGQNEGALYRNTTTPDGFTVDSEGRWVVNGAVQKSQVK
ncbi:N-acetylmuramoyl-L-alanine amidase family protein [Oribacterium sp.]